MNYYHLLKHFCEPHWGLAEGKVKILLLPLPSSLLSSRQYPKRQPAQISPLWRDQMERDSSETSD